MDERFDRFAKMAKEEFECTVSRSDKQETFENIFCNELSKNYDNSNEPLHIIKCAGFIPMDDYMKKRRLD